MSSIIILLLVTACGSLQKAKLDAEVDRLCAIDGGVRVYVNVTLPPDKFNKWGQVNFYRPDQGENTLGPDYIYKWDVHYYELGDSTSHGAHETVMKKDHFKVIRKSDMSLLGEVVMYHRAGGGMPGPWRTSSYHCPSQLEANEGILINRIFNRSNGAGNID
ncbi:MAG: hypothetical protein OEX11_00905 [Nitrosomonas sp.]|nr:hypothetical protein [Nitrosomonas sp.]